MAYAVIFDESQQVVRVTAVSARNMGMAIDCMRELRTNPKFKADYRILFDFRRQEFLPSSADAFGMGTLLQAFFAGQKLAFVISDSRCMRLQELALAAARSTVNAAVFSTLSAAESWLCNEPR